MATLIKPEKATNGPAAAAARCERCTGVYTQLAELLVATTAFGAAWDAKAEAFTGTTGITGGIELPELGEVACPHARSGVERR